MNDSYIQDISNLSFDARNAQMKDLLVQNIVGKEVILLLIGPQEWSLDEEFALCEDVKIGKYNYRIIQIDRITELQIEEIITNDDFRDFNSLYIIFDFNPNEHRLKLAERLIKYKQMHINKHFSNAPKFDEARIIFMIGDGDQIVITK